MKLEGEMLFLKNGKFDTQDINSFVNWPTFEKKNKYLKELMKNVFV